MTDLTFARPRHEYDSYRDFWTLVKLSGYPSCFIDEMETGDPDRVYIFTGPDATNEFKGAQARIIYWLLEWYGDYYQREGVAETWVSNETYAEQLGARFVPMGGHPGLGTLERGFAEWDIAHMSYHGIHRRNKYLNIFKEQFGISIAPNGWFQERDYILRHVSAMVHIHQNGDYPGIAPLRAVLSAAYGLPLIAEEGWSSAPYTDYIHTADLESMGRVILNVLSMDDIHGYGQRWHDRVCNELRFKKVVETYL
jgi:hypothetical protein